MELIRTITKEASDFFWEKIKRATLSEEAHEQIDEKVRDAIEKANEIMWQVNQDIDDIIEKDQTPKITQAEEMAMRDAFVYDCQIDRRCK